MARHAILLAIFCLLILPNARTNEQNPLLDIAASLLQNLGDGGGNEAGNAPGLAAIGNLVGSLMQGDNAKNLGSLLGQNGGNNAGDMLAGLGSLLGGQDGKIDPALIGSMFSMFAQQMGNTEAPKQQKREKRSQENGFDMENLMSLASGLLGNKNVGGYLPLIMNALGSFTDTEAEKRADDHKDHASFLPHYLEKVHLYWDIFINSELGITMWEKSGLKKAFKSFTGPDGKLSFEIMMKNFENHSYRRHWIKTAADTLTEYVVHAAKPENYKTHILTIKYVVNYFLDSQGFPKYTHFDIEKPDKSITTMVNFAMKKYFNMETDVGEYVKPAVEYVVQTLKMAEKATNTITSRGEHHVITDRLTDTLNLEVIEPVLRVYRAYKHSQKAPHCQEHLMCLVNRHHDHDKKGLPGFKAGLTKFSSLVASAALSYQNGAGFFDLYNAIQNDVNCDAAYPADCSAFHEHEHKVTTEVYHNEL